MLLRRSREEAEGERRMMGSWRLEETGAVRGLAGAAAAAAAAAAGRFASCVDDGFGGWPGREEAGCGGGLRCFRKTSAAFRTWEKSYDPINVASSGG
jgi:hypothetical protein